MSVEQGRRAGLMVVMAALALALAVPAGAVARVSPTGFSMSCRATPLADALVHERGPSIYAFASGRCTLTGSLGNAWLLDMSLRIQQRVGGAWRTRTDAESVSSRGGAVKSIDYAVASLDCSGPTRFARGPWRFRVIVHAYVNDKAGTTLKRDVADSGTTGFAC